MDRERFGKAKRRGRQTERQKDGKRNNQINTTRYNLAID